MTTLAKFDAADYLDNEEVIAEYLTAALDDPNPEVFLAAVADIARARGMTQLAKDTGLGRESLYKALAPGAKPRYAPILKVVRALGVKQGACVHCAGQAQRAGAESEVAANTRDPRRSHSVDDDFPGADHRRPVDFH